MQPATFFDAIAQLPSEFRPDATRDEGSLLVEPPLCLRDPLGGFLVELNWNRDHHLQSTPLALDDAELRRRTRECDHYTSNICVLLWFFHDYLERCRSTSATGGGSEANEAQARLLDVQAYLLPLQVDKLLGDVRSFLDSVYGLMLVFTPPEVVARLSNKVRESFGKFADRHDQGNLRALALPLTILEELLPWGQTVRKMRDDYIHRGKSSIAMPRIGPENGTQVYFDLHGFAKRPGRRDLPNVLYATDNPNDLLDLELLVLYIAVPVFALRRALGDSLRVHYSQAFNKWKSGGDGSSSSGGGISALGAMLQRRPEVLDAEIYRFRHSKPTTEAG